MYIAWFYPPGREKTHALGALDLALWDIKGKALGAARARAARRQRCATTASATARAAAVPPATPAARRSARLRERAKATMEAGYPRVPDGRRRRAGRRRLQHARSRCARRAQQCKEVREGVGPERRLVHRLPPALRPQRRAARLPGDRGVRALLRRGPGARRSTRSWTSRSCGR